MTDEWPKQIKYKGMIITLYRRDDQYEYSIGRDLGGEGYLSEGAAREAAEKAVDRKLAREAKKS